MTTPSLKAAVVAGLVVVAVGRASPAGTASPFEQAGRDVVVRTKRYELTLRDGVFVYVKNRLTGETYADARADTPDRTLVRGMSSTTLDERAFGQMHWQNGLACSEKQEHPCLVYPGPASAIRFRQPASTAAVVEYVGLTDGTRSFPSARLAVDLSVHPDTGELLIACRANTDKLAVAGVCACFAGLAESARVIVPTQGGHVFDRRWGDRLITLSWPRFWHFGVVIAEFARGTLSVWADDAKLNAKHLFIRRRDGRTALSVESLNGLPLDTHRAIDGVTWRFNTYAGNWVKPAGVYRDWLKRARNLVPLDKQRPRWVGGIRTVYSGLPDLKELHALADQLTPDQRRTVLYGMWQSWLNLETNTDVAPDGHRWLPYNPTWGRYKGRECVGPFIAEAHRLGFRVSLFTNLIAVNWAHPLLKQYGQYLQTQPYDPACGKPATRRCLAYIHQGNPAWQQFAVRTLKQLVRDYKVDCVYLDCSSVVRNGIQCNGLNPFQGTADWHKTVRRELPDLALLGEQVHEVTFAGEAFALESIQGWGSRKAQEYLYRSVHPISGCLFGEFTNRFRWGRGGRYHDNSERACHLPNHLIDRIRVFGRYGLRYVFPTDWDPSVWSYLKGSDGRTFRYVADRGSRFEAVDAAGQREVFYWRLHDTTTVDVPGTIDEWIGYDPSGRPVGLDPAGYYMLRPKGERAALPFCVRSLPPGAHIAEARVHDDWVLVKLGTTAEPPGKGRVGFTCERPVVQVATGSGRRAAVEKRGANTYVVGPLACNDALLVLSRPVPQETFPLDLLTRGWTWEMVRDGCAVRGLHKHQQARPGVSRRKRDQRNTILSACPYLKAEKRVYRLVRLPAAGRPVLGVYYRVAVRGKPNRYADGVRFVVRVNGTDVMQDVVKPNNTWRHKEFPLDAHRGQPVLVTLGAHGVRLGQYDYAQWGDVTIRID